MNRQRYQQRGRGYGRYYGGGPALWARLRPPPWLLRPAGYGRGVHPGTGYPPGYYGR